MTILLAEEFYKASKNYLNLFKKIEEKVSKSPVFEQPACYSSYSKIAEGLISHFKQTEQTWAHQPNAPKASNQDIEDARLINGEALKIMQRIDENIEAIERMVELSTQIYQMIRRPDLRNSNSINSLKDSFEFVAETQCLYTFNKQAAKYQKAFIEKVVKLENDPLQLQKKMGICSTTLNEELQANCFIYQLEWLQKSLSKSNQLDIHNRLELLCNDAKSYAETLSKHSLEPVRHSLEQTSMRAKELMETITHVDFIK